MTAIDVRAHRLRLLRVMLRTGSAWLQQLTPLRQLPPYLSRPELRLRLRRTPQRALRCVRYPNLWIPRRDLLLPGRQLAWQLRPADVVRLVVIRRPGKAGPEAVPADDVAPGAQRVRRDLPLTFAAGLGWVVAGLVLYTCYLHVSRTVPANSDGASNALQAWAMLHGNPLLRGWVLSDVSFYTTELPQYMIIELVRGLTPDVMHIAGAMTYAIVVLLAARLAKGGATGVDGLLRAGLAVGIMVAPQQSSVGVLMLQPDHVGTAAPVLLLFLLLDRAARKWYVPPLAFLVVGWSLVADQVVLITAAGPLAFVGLARAYNATVRKREPARTVWFELALTAAAAAGVFAGERTLAVIKASGGFVVMPVSNVLAPFDQLAHNLQQVVLGTLVLFSANFPGDRVSFAAVDAMLHLIGAGLVAWAVAGALRRFAGGDLAVQLLAVAVPLSIVACLLGPKAAQPDNSREFAAVLPLGAALAGRLLAGRLRQARLVPALAAVLGVYVAGLVMLVAKPPAPAQNQALAGWLAAHRLSYGLADYWLANSTTVDSGGKVQVLAIRNGSWVWPARWESEASWYSASSHLANFVVLPSTGAGPWSLAPSAAGMIKVFGQPSTVYFLSSYTVLVWNSNLLGKLA